MSDKFRYTAGLNNVGSYQVSGKTFITASTVNDGEEDQIQFPDVTNNIKVKLDSAGGVTKNGYVLNGTLRLGEFTNDFVHRANEAYVMWVKRVNPDSNGNQYLLRVLNATQILFNSNTNEVRIENFLDGGSHRTATANHDFLSMTHLVYTIDHDDSAKLYINNSLVATIDLTPGSGAIGKVRGSKSVQLSIGTHGVDFDWGFIEFAKFQSTFSPSDVAEAYNGGNYLDLNSHSKSGDLEHYWLFGDDAGDSFSGVRS